MIVVIGARGQVGTAFRRLLGDHATYLTRDQFDLSETASQIPRVLEPLEPEVVINCGAYTAVDLAETNSATAQKVNADAVRDLAAFTQHLGARFVTFSTDHVFGGTGGRPYVESDRSEPVNVYGRTKRAGEVMALEANPETLVVRTSWVISGSRRNFARSILEATRTGPISVVDDQWGRPTIADELATAVLDAVHRPVEGLLHLTNQGTTSRFGLAREVLTLANVDPERVRPCTTAEYQAVARRPANGVLGSERCEALGLSSLPHYEAGLARSVDSIVATMPSMEA